MFHPFARSAALLAIAVAGAAQAQPRPAGEQALFSAETQRLDAQVASDVATLSRLIADDAVYIHANGQTQGKRDYLADVAAGKIRWRGYEAGEQTARISKDSAITHALITMHVGTDRRIVARTTGVYALDNGNWKLLSWQSTPVAD